MKVLGIDYGSKKVGLALSDAGGSIAFPHSVVSNDEKLVPAIVVLCEKEKINTIALGDGRTALGSENEITKSIESLRNILISKELSVILVPEHGTSGAVSAGLGEGAVRGEIQSPRSTERDFNDAKAAALILQRYLDIHRGKR